MSAWSGFDKVNFQEPIGSVYELNNRVLHSAEHAGADGIYALLVLDVAQPGLIFTERDNVEKVPQVQTFNLPARLAR